MKSKIHIINSLLFMSLTAYVLAPAASAATADSNPVETVEMSVYAEMSLRKLRLEINKSQEAMFNVFNDLNNDDRFDIHCEYVKRWQSIIREFECAPTFLKTAREEEVNFFLGNLVGTGGEGETAPVVGLQSGGAGVSQMNRFNALLEKEMKAIFQEQAQFREAMEKYNALQEIYEDRRK